MNNSGYKNIIKTVYLQGNMIKLVGVQNVSGGTV